MASTTRAGRGRSIGAQPASFQTALVVIDMISCWDFPDADRLLPRAAQVARPIARLARRCRGAGVPVIYANDNRGRWRSDMQGLIDLSLSAGGRGAAITRELLPEEQDYVVLKPKHSIFHHTPMPLLLEHLRARRLILTGVASDQCILTSVSEARMRELEAVVPADCSAAQTPRRHAVLLDQLRHVWKVRTTASRRLPLNARR